MSREAYKKQFVVIDNSTNIPLSNQPYYTLQQAVDRLGREERQAMRLFPDVEKREIRKWFGVININTGEHVV